MTLQCSSLFPSIDHLPDSPATYVISQRGKVQCVGSSNSLWYAMHQHTHTGRKRFHFDNLSLCHFFNHADKYLANSIRERIKNYEPTTISYHVNQFPYWLTEYYLSRIDRTIRAMPDDCAAVTMKYTDEIARYYRIIADNNRLEEYIELSKSWQQKALTIRKLAGVA